MIRKTTRRFHRVTLELLECRDLPSFFTPSPIPIGDSPAAVAGGDFNGDGRLDLVAANKTTPGKVSLLLNNGGGTFAPFKSFPAGGNSPSSIAVEDFNANGTLDVVVTNSASDTVSVLRGSGSGAFRRPVSYPAGPSPTSVTYGEFTGDGRFDLAVANSTATTVSVLVNNGDGTYGAVTSYNIGAGALSVISGEFSGDGLDDLVAVGSDRVAVLLGTGTGSFVSGASYVGGSPVDVAAGDFNSDGNLDVAVGQSTGDVEVRLGNGDGTFQAPLILFVGAFLASVDVDDLDHDGDLDIAAVRNSGTPVGVLLNNGNGSFKAAQYYGSIATSIAVLDVTGDGFRDLAAASSSADYVTVLPGSSDGSFVVPPTLGTGGGRHVTVADLNGDGDPDFATAAAGKPMKVFLGGSGTQFQAAIDAWGGGGQFAITHDVDNDSDLDLKNFVNPLTIAIDLGIVKANGDGTFDTAPKVSGIPAYNSAVAGDVDGDGKADLVVANDGGPAVLLGNGDGTFKSPMYGPAAPGDELLLLDLNGDANLDLVARHGILSSSFKVLLGNGNGTFKAAASYSAQFTEDFAAGDFNGDGFPDLAVSQRSTQYTVELHLNQGNGTFLYAGALYFSTYDLKSIVAADFNGDGIDDIAVSETLPTTTNRIVTLLCNGDGTFKPGQWTSAALNLTDLDLATADFNGDGIWDLAMGDYDSVVIRMGAGNGLFGVAQAYPTVGGARVKIGDFNSDGAADVAQNTQGVVGVLVGNGDGTFAVEHRLSDEQSFSGPHVDGAVADFNGDGRQDLVVRNTILLGTPDGFDAARGFLIDNLNPNNRAITTGDFNGDGIPDLTSAHFGSSPTYAGSVSVLLGISGGLYSTPVVYPTGNGGTGDVEAADFNEDGFLDLIASNLSGTVRLLLGNGNGTFQSAVSIPGGATPYGLAVGDFDADGDLDVATTSWDPLYSGAPGQVAILLGNGNGTFNSPVNYPVGSSPRSIVAADFNLDGILDLATANEGDDNATVLMGNGDGAALSSLSPSP